MKYVLPLMLAGSAAWAATRHEQKPWIGLEPQRVEAAPQPETPPWMTALQSASEVDPHAISKSSGNPHVGLHATDDPHAGLYGDDAPHAAQCPHFGVDESPHVHAARADDPHALVRSGSPDVATPAAPLARSTAANGHDIAGLFAKRAELSEQLVRVHGVIVKKTEGILGKTYLHLRDGTGSTERGDNDLTVTTTEEFHPGEIVEVEGRMRIDQDLGVGYRYAALLDGATRVQLN